VNQLEVDTWPINYYFFIFLKKILKKYLFQKTKEKKERKYGVAEPPLVFFFSFLKKYIYFLIFF
jgi:hypothetical protein